MQTINCNNLEFTQIKNGIQLYKIFDSDLNFEFLENCKLVNKSTDEQLNIQITSIKRFSNIKDVLSVINLEKFGKYETQSMFENYINNEYSLNDNVLVCRIKNLDSDNVEIKDKKLKEMILINTLEKYNLGLSGCQVYSVLTKNNKNAILKIQNIAGADSLKEEFDILYYLKDKWNIATPYYYNKINNEEYLLRELLEGEPLYKFKNFGFKLGKELKKLHKNYDCNCIFDKFSTDNLLSNALENIDVVFRARNDKFENFSKQDIIKFLKDNKPKNDSLIHGDFSLTNILNNNGIYSYIDLGNVSISTKYFDIYVLKKSLKINNLEDEYDEFLKGYGIDDYDEKYIDWMGFIESSYN